jgi:hypothetical protein
LLDILQPTFEFGSAIAAPINLLDILQPTFEFGSAIAAPTC